ncbi:GGDEF domain-containing protein [Reinekea thalattae]|uniref:diguanylate cyclase n=1 Tax=Reinekea thalattae TaxID=2593301 RepID=A0A5C8Z1H9_9GAMM|nr:GGDEF domain-containing protein [Reinekea thalattae]TXR51377.1 GGDEF domain-containing protein [Reinekea thalattae]
MRFKANKTLYILPLVTLLLATALVFYHQRFSSTVHEALLLLPYALAAVAVWLSVQFSKRQLLISVLISITSYAIIQLKLQQPLSLPSVLIAYSLLSLWVPICLLINLLVKENGLMATSSKIVYGLIALVTLIIIILYNSSSESLLIWIQQYFAPKPTTFFILSWNALFITLGCLIISLLLFIVKQTAVSLSLVLILVTNTLPLMLLNIDFISTSYLSAAMIITLFACIKTSHELAYRDQLTGLLGRRALFEQLASISGRYTIAMVDIDHFKKFNDTYGHDVGDDVLALVAAKISEVGGKGLAYRYGGEEFTLLFPGKDASEAAPFLEEVCSSVANTPFYVRNKTARKNSSAEHRSKGNNTSKTVKITVSIGGATKPSGRIEPEKVLKLADKALYKAKDSGRNQVKLSG